MGVLLVTLAVRAAGIAVPVVPVVPVVLVPPVTLVALVPVATPLVALVTVALVAMLDRGMFTVDADVGDCASLRESMPTPPRRFGSNDAACVCNAGEKA